MALPEFSDDDAWREEAPDDQSWRGESAEDIPALQCAGCGEQYYDDTTIVALDLLRGAGFDAGDARRHLSVPVFSLLDAFAALPRDAQDVDEDATLPRARVAA